jgi:Flp pilus assembly protein TadD
VDRTATGRVAVAAADRLADPTEPTAQVRAHRILAYAYIRLGRFDDAHIHLNHALDLVTQTGDQTGQAHIQGNLWPRGNAARAVLRDAVMVAVNFVLDVPL